MNRVGRTTKARESADRRLCSSGLWADGGDGKEREFGGGSSGRCGFWSRPAMYSVSQVDRSLDKDSVDITPYFTSYKPSANLHTRVLKSDRGSESHGPSGPIQTYLA